MKEDGDEAVLCVMCTIIYFQYCGLCIFRVSDRDFSVQCVTIILA